MIHVGLLHLRSSHIMPRGQNIAYITLFQLHSAHARLSANAKNSHFTFVADRRALLQHNTANMD